MAEARYFHEFISDHSRERDRIGPQEGLRASQLDRAHRVLRCRAAGPALCGKGSAADEQKHDARSTEALP
ncbi:MAG: hypothetical protein AUG03_06405 [Acidobacteria bacterium 13_1_20CM_2_68_14]|nr:MAG: hypothetical protein AUG03_06405 [Acidobacteria bacterium 13_1_20CM_2_68_14]